jgi:hypothetical protein
VDTAWQLLQKSSIVDKELADLNSLFEEFEFDSLQDSEERTEIRESNVQVLVPRVTIPLEMFNQFKIKFFKYLHLLYEDLKLKVMMKELVSKLGFFLYSYANFLEVPNVANYMEYYSRDNYEYPFMFVSFESLQLVAKIQKRKQNQSPASQFTASFETEEKLFELEMLEEDPYDLNRYIGSVIESKEQKKYPVMYRQSHFVSKVIGKKFAKSKRYFKVFHRPATHSETWVESQLGSTPLSRIYFFLDEKAKIDGKVNNVVARRNLKQKCVKANDEIYLFMIDSRFKQTGLDTLNSTCRTIIENIIRELRVDLPSYIYSASLPKGAYTLINREDIYMNMLLYPKAKPTKTNSSFMAPSFIDRNTSMLSDRTSNEILYSNYSHIKEDKKDPKPEEYSHKKVASFMEHIHNVRLGENDLVFNEIQRMLNISDLIRIKSKYIEHAHEDEDKLEFEAQNLLRRFAVRRMSVLIGRGATTINTDRSLFTEVLHIPKINLIALLENSNRKVTLERKEENMNWPEFHNGVSVGLKIPREILEQKNKDTLRTWIDYQKTNYESFDKSGLCYALGLQGLLYCFQPTDMYLYLKPYYEPRSIGIMLGLAASKIGSRDESVHKTIGVHLSCMLPENAELHLAMTVDCAALVSYGLLYKGTCNKQLTHQMLKQILATPTKEKNHEREAYPTPFT